MDDGGATTTPSQYRGISIPASPHSLLSQIPFHLLRTLLNRSGARAQLEAAERVLISLSQYGPLELFDTWTPVRDAPVEELAIPPSCAFASCCSESSAAQNAVLEESAGGSGAWVSSSGASASTWGILMPTSFELASVTVEWMHPHIPASIDLCVAPIGASPVWTPLRRLSGSEVCELTSIAIPRGVHAGALCLQLTGQRTSRAPTEGEAPAASTSTSMHAIHRVRVLRYREEDSSGDAGSAVCLFTEWFSALGGHIATSSSGSSGGSTHSATAAELNEPSRAADGNDSPQKLALSGADYDDESMARWDIATEGLARLACVSGSLAPLLELLRLLTTRPLRTALSPGTATVGISLLAAIRAELGAARQRLGVQEYTASGSARRGGLLASAYGPLHAEFDPAFASAGISLSNGNKTATSSFGMHCYALLDIGPFVEGQASWVFKLDEDTTSQCTCFGMATKPVDGSNYEYR